MEPAAGPSSTFTSREELSEGNDNGEGERSARSYVEGNGAKVTGGGYADPCRAPWQGHTGGFAILGAVVSMITQKPQGEFSYRVTASCSLRGLMGSHPLCLHSD